MCPPVGPPLSVGRYRSYRAGWPSEHMQVTPMRCTVTVPCIPRQQGQQRLLIYASRSSCEAVANACMKSTMCPKTNRLRPHIGSRRRSMRPLRRPDRRPESHCGDLQFALSPCASPGTPGVLKPWGAGAHTLMTQCNTPCYQEAVSL